MSVEWNTIKVEITDAGNVTLHMTHRSAWSVIKRTRFTITRREFESALKTAKITVPWQRVNHG